MILHKDIVWQLPRHRDGIIGYNNIGKITNYWLSTKPKQCFGEMMTYGFQICRSRKIDKY